VTQFAPMSRRGLAMCPKTTGQGGLSAARVVRAYQAVDQTLAYAVRAR
jgi:hypothetical protein